MSPQLPLESTQPWLMLELSLTTLTAMGENPELTCGGLSPLLRLPAPSQPSDHAGVAEMISRAQALSPWALPTLLDPRLTVALVVGDPDDPALRQYAWPDAQGQGPGFEIITGESALTLRGGIDLPVLREAVASLLAVSDLPSGPVYSLSLSARQFWVLLALVDAYRQSLALRRLQRSGGHPQALLVTDILAAWRLGQENHHPGWAVTLFSLLAPSEVPSQFEQTLRQTLDEMDEDELVILLEGDLSLGTGATVVLGEVLAPWVSGLAQNPLLFGLAVQRAHLPHEAQATVLGGWRTPGAVWLADLADLEQDSVALIVAGQDYVAEILNQVLAGNPDPHFAPPPPLVSEQQLNSPSTLPAPPPPAAHCTECGACLEQHWRYCEKCGMEIQKS